jgi:hypothetical protein
MTANTPTIVFVHGAWADASGFSDAGRAAIHGRAWKRADRGGGGLARVHGVAARGRDTADPQRRRGDEPEPAVKV